MGLRQVIRVGLHISKYTMNNYNIISTVKCRKQKLLMYIINIFSCDRRILYYYYDYYHNHHYRRRNGTNKVKIN